MRPEQLIWLVTLLAAPLVSLAADLGQAQLALLKDSGGWEYLKMGTNNGFPTQHTCFDGKPHPEMCSAVLYLGSNGNFRQQTTVKGQTVTRGGTYTLDGDQLTFIDEFGNNDGPYTVAIDPLNKVMTMNMPQVDVRLLLYSEYKRQMDGSRRKKRRQQ